MIPEIHEKNDAPAFDPETPPPEEIELIRDCDGKSYPVTVLHSEEESKGLQLDFRVRTADDTISRSCFAGIALDPLFIRTQVFVLHDGTSCIGQSTLMAIPRKHFARDILFKKNGKKLRCGPFLDLFGPAPVPFVIETGTIVIDQKYRPKKLELPLFRRVLLPKINQLCATFRREIAIRTSVMGPLQGEAEDKIHRSMMEFFQSPDCLEREIPITPEMERALGRFPPESTSTLLQARESQTCLPDVFGDGLGPVFVKVVREP